ncbi:MAG: NnrS family protein, partial [Proteobacteria bacterium]|nr:NnrS family protein [Pseudomonadota bacterium]
TTMIMAVAISAGKGHSGRALTSDAQTNAAFILITGAAVTRVGSALLAFEWLLWLSALLWLLAFLVFIVVVVPILVMPPIKNSATLNS